LTGLIASSYYDPAKPAIKRNRLAIRLWQLDFTDEQAFGACDAENKMGKNAKKFIGKQNGDAAADARAIQRLC